MLSFRAAVSACYAGRREAAICLQKGAGTGEKASSPNMVQEYICLYARRDAKKNDFVVKYGVYKK